MVYWLQYWLKAIAEAAQTGSRMNDGGGAMDGDELW